MIQRKQYKTLKVKLFKGKAIIVSGPRQVGKTTMILELLNEITHSHLFLNADDPTTRQLLDNPNTEQLRSILGTAEIIFIDEAQRIPNIGLTSKIIIDQFKDKQLILSGSSSFELSGNLKEPLTGRKWTFEMFPVSWEEWQNYSGYLKAEQDLENRLVFGFYPDVLINTENQAEILTELVESYLYKDVLTFAGLRKPEMIQNLVQALSYQVGKEVSYKEIGDLIGVDSKTVANYIDVLEKAFVIFRLTSFSRNLRNEIKSNRKIYFYDNGIRNAVIGMLDPVQNRTDIGALWENFLISERLKFLHYNKHTVRTHFWRTKQQQEVDYVEVKNNLVSGYEFKWNIKKKPRFPKTFVETYTAKTKVINRENFREFLGM